MSMFLCAAEGLVTHRYMNRVEGGGEFVSDFQMWLEDAVFLPYSTSFCITSLNFFCRCLGCGTTTHPKICGQE